MRASTPISNISYNTDEFLVKVLNDLIFEHSIEFWAYINHYAESDETKDHKHIYIIPSGLIDTFSLQDRFRELDLLNPNKPPLTVKVFRRSVFAEWYLYALHDEDYLAKKGIELRRFHYHKEEIIVSDNDYFIELIHTSDFTKYKNVSKIRDIVRSGVSFRDLVKNGHIPIQQINQWEKFYHLVAGAEIEPVSGGGGSSEGVPFTGTPLEPAQGELLQNDIYEYINSDGEIMTMHKVYKYDDLPF